MFKMKKALVKAPNVKIAGAMKHQNPIDFDKITKESQKLVKKKK